MSEQPTEPFVGWRVVDPDGNVVASGPPIVMEMTAECGELLSEENV